MIRAATLSWYWHRLRAMDSAEIVSRLAEKTRAFNEQSSLTQLDAFRLGPPQAGQTHLLPDRTHASNRVRAAISENAANLREGRWLLHGWKEITMPDPPAWDWDGVHDRRAPLDLPVNQIDHRRLPSGADPRSIWEVNRWAELVRLAQNAWLNQHDEDARLTQRWLDDWLVRNPVGNGINWTSPLEAALRLLHFTWIDTLLRACDDDNVRTKQERLAAQIVPAHAWWVWRHRSFGSSANNHLIGELAATVLAARRWPCLMHLTCCAEKAWQKLQDEVLRQFAPDGGNREQAMHYHLFAWTLVWQARRVMGPGSVEFETRLSNAAAFFSQLSHPQAPWDFGDSDDAEITPFTGHRRSQLVEWNSWIHSSAAKEDDRISFQDEALRFWLGAPPLVPSSDNPNWRLFQDSGHVVKRSGPWMARFDASPLGFGSMAAHGHLDALQLSLWHEDKAVLIDPGTGAYFSDPALRARLAGWESHNAPVPESVRQAPKRGGPFLWTQHHEPPGLKVENGTAVACLANDGPFVKRQVRLDDTGCEVIDRISTAIPHWVTWTLAPGWQVQRTGCAQQYKLVHDSGLRLEMRFESDCLLEVSLVAIEASPHFLQIEVVSALRARFSSELKTYIHSGKKARLSS